MTKYEKIDKIFKRKNITKEDIKQYLNIGSLLNVALIKNGQALYIEEMADLGVDPAYYGISIELNELQYKTLKDMGVKEL